MFCSRFMWSAKYKEKDWGRGRERERVYLMDWRYIACYAQKTHWKDLAQHIVVICVFCDFRSGSKSGKAVTKPWKCIANTPFSGKYFELSLNLFFFRSKITSFYQLKLLLYIWVELTVFLAVASLLPLSFIFHFVSLFIFLALFPYTLLLRFHSFLMCDECMAACLTVLPSF